MATHSSVLAWRIPGTGEPGGLLSMGSHRVGHDWSNLAAAAAYWEIFPGGSDGKESSLGWEDSLEKGMETHPSILAWRFPWTEEPGGLQSTGLQRIWHDWATNTFPLSHWCSITALSQKFWSSVSLSVCKFLYLQLLFWWISCCYCFEHSSQF